MPPAQHRSAAPARLVRRGRRGRLVREGAGEVVPERVEGGRHRTEGPDQCLLVPRRAAATLAAKALVSELGLGPQPRENCAQRVGGRVTGKRGKAYCSTMDLNADFLQPGGMAYVPWKAGTEALFPPLVRTASYPPPPGEYWTPDDEAARMVELPTR